eukprot:CAMPEP_0194218650 /NCGR_PEP_ID=MMETSP0156-20130528/24272_1 /TAXON_ID=33649 /ORGANISM="Thalassionema nitzschioides, Strain L26-B" /LENGTH=429 /DNA_ID=CAMNT_0038948087 /DNA_START=31 /DNA_END=1320 /DNA_ORIENTATION=-
MTTGFATSNVECVDLARSSFPISTGIGFLDHMIDQFNSHAQIGVSITVDQRKNEQESGTCVLNNGNAYACMDQSVLLPLCGEALGKSMKALLLDVQIGASSRFCCPLDEALVECEIAKKSSGEGRLVHFSLPPYGIYPRSTGRTKIGEMETQPVEGFMRSFVEAAGLEMSLHKITGDNGHHIIESSFKAFSRALRNLIDGTNTNVYGTKPFLELWGPNSQSWTQSLALERQGQHNRKTKETYILVDLKLDGGVKGNSIDTGIPDLDDIFEALAREASLSLEMKCQGDLWVDDHHTSEDVSIALGQVLDKALGTKAGLNRMWCAKAMIGEAAMEVTMDLSNRPFLTENLTESEEEYIGGALTTEMFHHMLESLAMNARMTVHIVEIQKGATMKDSALAIAMAFGRTLKMCAAVDPRRAGKTASSKGTLSV